VTARRHTVLDGVVPMLVTPFESDGTVDEVSLRRLVAYQVEAGAEALAILGLAGEAAYLSLPERQRVVEVVLETAAGVPVLVGCTAATTDEAIRLISSAAERGAAMAMVAAPNRADWSVADLLAHFRAVAEAAECGLMIQDAPQFIGVELGVGHVLELAHELESVRAYKIETLPFWENAERARTAAGEQLQLFGGHGGLYLLDALDVGADGVIPGPDMTATLVATWRAYARGNRRDAVDQYTRVLPLLVHEAQSLGLLIGGAKAILEARGVIATVHSRHAGANLSRATAERMLSLAREVGVLV
jgi:dihydrodipicolinate synthase/N-acetylneuraminate lyase